VQCREGGIDGHLVVATALFEVDTGQRMALHLSTLLAAVAAQPALQLSRISLMTPEEERLVLHTFNDTAGPLPTLCVHQFFEQQAAATPAAVCLVDGRSGASLTYHELDARSNQMAAHLAAAGVAADKPVAVLMDKCFEVYIALIAVLKAGGCYVPIDHTAPAKRVINILQQCGARVLVTQAGSAPAAEQLPAGTDVLVADSLWQQFSSLPADSLQPRSQPNDLYTIMFTSGSTGEPKGIPVEHAGSAALHGTDWMMTAGS
jgi:non-ribosomal peptide synthetase component F